MANKGNYYKLRTKKWLENKGYQVATMEKMFRIFRPGAEALFVKKDQFGADLLAMNEKELIFVQVKFNTARTKVEEAIREFNKYRFPPSQTIKRWVVVWEKGGHEPEITEC